MPDDKRPPELPSAGTPEEFENLKVKKVKEKAAGLTSVLNALKYAYGKMGLLRGTKALANLNQFGGVDCQSCAWADPDDERKRNEYCENGARAMADEATKRLVDGRFFAESTVAELSHRSDYWLNKQGRIEQPLYLARGAAHYEPISWKSAFAMIAEELNSLDSPDEAVFYTSGRTSNEAAFLYQLFVRQFGTNNLPDCSNMCHESSGAALGETIGIGKGTVRIKDFEKCDLLIIIGQNPGTNHPRMMSSLEKAKRNGAKMISINPLPEAGLMNFVQPNPGEHSSLLTFPFKLLAGKGTALSDLHLPVRIGGDMALMKGLVKCLLAIEAEKGGVLDHDFIAGKTSGYNDLRESLESVSWDEIEEFSGLSKDQIEQAAKVIARSKRIITCWAMGLTQHREAVGTIQEIVNLHLMLGQIGKEGAGLCPVRGHSNVQGDRTVGISDKPKEWFLKALDENFGFEAPRKHGFDSVESIKAMHDGRAKVFFAMGGNFLSATPDTEFTAEALRKCRLTVQVITKLNRSALITGERALILPPLGRSDIDVQASGEQFVSTENSTGVVQMSKGVLKPLSKHWRSEPWIVGEMAKTVLGERTTVDWDSLLEDYDRIRDAIERTIPGFDEYNRRVRWNGGFYLPNEPREGRFGTRDGRAHFTVHELKGRKLSGGEFILTSIRAHDQFNTTVYDLNDRYRGIRGERRVLLMNPEDMKAEGFRTGQVVDITSHFEDQKRTARHFIVVPYPAPSRCLATYFPEANVLVPIGSVAKTSNTPTSKSLIVTISKHLGKDEVAGKFDYDYSAESQFR
ncbi:MAG TPA: FdhF/YdeP family oxidoreductase [Aridibacter sp.]|nr:FdhF/YdeP family oxidoreductase [Aridibacter sp.]